MDTTTRVSNLKRPRLLVHAARKGLQTYRRDRDLKAALKAGAVPGNALRRLADEEAALEATRVSSHATYSPLRHIAVLTALMAEARL